MVLEKKLSFQNVSWADSQSLRALGLKTMQKIHLGCLLNKRRPRNYPIEIVTQSVWEGARGFCILVTYGVKRMHWTQKKRREKKLNFYPCSHTKTMDDLGLLTAIITPIAIIHRALTTFRDLRYSTWNLPKSCEVVFCVSVCAPCTPPSAKSLVPHCVEEVPFPLFTWLEELPAVPWLEWRQARAEGRCCPLSLGRVPEPALLEIWWFSLVFHFMTYLGAVL